MVKRFKTTLDAETKIVELQSALQTTTKAAIIRLAIAFSLKESDDPRFVDGKEVKYSMKGKNGADYAISTIYADDEIIYKVLMEEKLGHSITDEEFYPDLTSAHVERGIRLLHSEYKLRGNKNEFLEYLLEVI